MIPSAQLAHFKDRLPQLNILVIGDLMLDRYLWGQVSRISPEAPVPVVDVTHSEGRPGGAANVALNLARLGARVSLSGVVGEDQEGHQLLELLRDQQFDTRCILQDSSRPTTTKTRVIAHKQHVLRVDREERENLPEASLEALWKLLEKDLPQFDAVVFEDYDKGVIHPTLVQRVTAACIARGIPVTVDPKFRNFFAYKGVTLFKPNLKELNEGLGIRVDRYDLEGLRRAVLDLRKQMPHAMTLITLSENGVLAVDDQGAAHHVPAHFRKITDVSGAGDTVVALMTLALACPLPLATAAAIANLGGGLVCEEVGVVPVEPERLFAELEKQTPS